jgi:rhodanese-related sulfurtransferase
MKLKETGPIRSQPQGDRFASDHFQFRFQTLSETRLELNACNIPKQILEIFLLTAMGTLGLKSGFALLIYRPAETFELISRGLADEEAKRLEQSLPQILSTCFDSKPEAAGEKVSLLWPEDLARFPFCPLQIGLGLTFTIEPGDCALIGFGNKILSDVFYDADLSFLLNLNASLMSALEKADLRRQQRLLSEQLRTKTSELEKADHRIDRIRRELDLRLLHLTSFNEMVRELSGIQDTPKILEGFLLSVMGIVGSNGGCLALADDKAKNLHLACRGAAEKKIMTSLKAASPQVIHELSQHISAAGLTPMAAAILSEGQSLGPVLDQLRLSMGLVFCLDSHVHGILGLGEKIGGQAFVQTDQDLLLGLTQLLMMFLKNASALEAVRTLNQALERQNVDLVRGVEDLKASRRVIETLERAKERFKSAVANEMERSRRFSFRDVLMILLLGLGLGLLFNFANPNGIHLLPEGFRQPAPAMLDAKTAREKQLTETVLFVDARPAEFFNQGHIAAAVNLPLALFDFVYMMRFGNLAPQTEIIVYGRNISRRYDEQAARRLAARGHPNVKILVGGVIAWQKLGLPMEP